MIPTWIRKRPKCLESSKNGVSRHFHVQELKKRRFRYILSSNALSAYSPIVFVFVEFPPKTLRFGSSTASAAVASSGSSAEYAASAARNVALWIRLVGFVRSGAL